MGINIHPDGCSKRQPCQCTPLHLMSWRGNPPWVDGENDLTADPFAPNAAAFLATIDAQQIAGTTYQWRITYDWESIVAEKERLLASLPMPALPQLFVGGYAPMTGGPVRDGLLINLPGSNGASIASDDVIFTRDDIFTYAWRLELGCVRCRCRDALSIFWPIRHDADIDYTVAVGGAVTINSVDRVLDTDDYGRDLTDDELTRYYWHGGGPTESQIVLTEPRRCPPDEIVWSPRHTLNNASIGSLAGMSALRQRRDGLIQTALGWMTDGPTLPSLGPPRIDWAYAATIPQVQYRERFDTVDISQVNRITLIQPITYEAEDYPLPPPEHLWAWRPPNADPSTITQEEIDALVSWLDDGPPRLLTISGCGDTLGQINSFLSRFCSLRWAEYAQTNLPDPPLPGISLVDDSSADPHLFQNPRFVPTDHQFAGDETIYTARVPKVLDRYFYPGVSGGETLYNIEYELGPAGNPQTLSFPAVAMETRPGGSRIVFAPQFRQYSPTQTGNIINTSEVETHSPYFDCNWNPLDRGGWLGNHVAALLDLYPPTIPRNASVTG